MNYAPIETSYKGYRFRSRLEARWAVFFDKAEIKYQYEVEGYEITIPLDGEIVRYLPDFYLEDYDCYVEVKGTDDALKRDSEKLAWMIDYNASPISKGLLILGDLPDIDRMTWGNYPLFSYLHWDSGVSHDYATFNDLGRLIIGTNNILRNVYTYSAKHTSTAPNIPPEASTKCKWSNDDLRSREVFDFIKSAYKAAKSARFEYQ